MIPNESLRRISETKGRDLTDVFDRRLPEQREARDFFRSAFAETATLEAVSEHLYVLHIEPGSVRRARDAA